MFVLHMELTDLCVSYKFITILTLLLSCFEVMFHLVPMVTSILVLWKESLSNNGWSTIQLISTWRTTTSRLRLLKTKKTTKYADGYPYTDLGQAQKYVGKALFGFRCLSPLKFELIHSINNNM